MTGRPDALAIGVSGFRRRSPHATFVQPRRDGSHAPFDAVPAQPRKPNKRTFRALL